LTMCIKGHLCAFSLRTEVKQGWVGVRCGCEAWVQGQVWLWCQKCMS
jgi:hypothetical protein